MKNTFIKYAFIAAMPLLFSQCQDVLDEPQGDKEGATVDLVISAPSGDTKTMLVDNSKVVWDEGDRIIVNGNHYPVLVNEDDPTYATVLGVDRHDGYVAVYPEGYGHWYDEYISVYMMQEYAHRKGSFDMLTNPMVAAGEGTNLSFVNLGGVIRLGLTGEGETISYLQLKSNDGTPISGELRIMKSDLLSGNYDAEAMEWGNDYVMIRFDEPLVLSAEPEYVYVVVAPGTMENGFTVSTVDEESAVCEIKTTRSVTVQRAKIKQMEDVKCEFANPIVLNAKEVTATSAVVELSMKPGYTVKYAVFDKTSYEEKCKTERAWALLSDFGQELWSYENENGNYQFTVSDATYFNDNWGVSNPIVADEDYVIVAAYYMANRVTGGLVTKEFRTAAPYGEAPLLTMELANVDWTTAYFNVVAYNYSIRTLGIPKIWYDNLASEGKTDREILMSMGGATDVWSYGEVIQLSFSGHYAETDYVFLAMATSEGGMDTLVKKEYRTLSYAESNIPEGAEWKVLTYDGEFGCGFFRDKNGERLVIKGLKIEMLEDGSFYRVENMFSVAKNPDLAIYGFVDTGETTYTYLDNREGRYAIHIMGNPLSVKTAQSPVLFVGAESSHPNYGGWLEGGWYDDYENRIYFYNLTIMDIYDRLVVSRYEDSYLSLKRKTPLDTEDYTNNNGVVEW